MTAAGVITFVGVAHPWMCDAMGHVNTRYYAGMFDDASFQLLGRIVGNTAEDKTDAGWADVHSEIDYKHETRAGALLTIYSSVEKIGKSSLTYVHVLTGSFDGVVHAQARIITVRFDLVARCKIDLEAALRANAERLVSDNHIIGER